MKNRCLILIVFLFVIDSVAFSQKTSEAEKTAATCKLGVEVAINYADYIGSGDQNLVWQNNGIIGGNIGAYLYITHNNKFIFQPELLFSVKGGKDTYYTDDYPYQSTYAYSHISIQTNHLFYIELPLTLKYFIKKQFFIAGGPYIGAWVGGVYYEEGSTTTNGITTTQAPVTGSYKISEERLADIPEIGITIDGGITLKNGLNVGVKFMGGSFYSFSSSPLENISAGFYAEYGL